MKKLSALLLLVSMLLLAKTTLYAQTPTISSFTPTSGAPGTLFTITGTNLSNPTAFKIGGVTASAIVVSNTGTSLVAMVLPSAATGTIAATTAGGTATSSGTFTVQNTSYPIVQQGNKLVGTSALVTPGQGWAVTLSADGTTALVGGYYDNNGVGATWVYTRSGNTWAQQVKLIGTGAATNAWQGFSVALSADGNTAIVGGVIDNSAWVFTRSGTTWAQQGNKLVASDRVGNAWFGKSVSLSADGNTALVGGLWDNTNIGATWVFTRSGTTWTQQGTKLVGTGPVGAAQQGTAVALSADGNIAAIGGATDDTNKGATWVFTRSGTTWTQQGNKLIGTGTAGADKQGQSVALSADATTLIIGGVNATSNVSNAWVFTRSGTTWSQQGSKLAGSDAVGTAANGTSVTLTADGNTAMMGSVSDNYNTGAAWVFTRSGTTWSQQGNKLLGTGATGTTLYEGRSVSLSADGSTALVGADGDNTNQGAVWAYSTGVIYDGNGNTGGTVPSSALATISSSITLATNTGTLVKTGYTFAGWNTLANGTGTSYAEGASHTFAGTVRLYAKWTPNNYTVTFNVNGGTGLMSSQTIANGASSNLTSNNFTRTGYTFAGWNTLANGTGTSYANGASYTMGAANVTLYAQWCNTAGTASSTPTICINTALNNITHTTTGATGIGTATGLPTGVSASWANNTITISGTPTASGTFTYSIPLTGGCSSVSATGTITVTAAMVILLPVDNVPNASLALSLRKLRSAYSGPALRLRRGSDNVEQDFAFVGNDLDVNAITTWLNGASGYCTKLYDQSGNAGDVSQVIAAAQPLLVLSGFNNKPLLRFTTVQSMYNTVNYPAPFSVIYGSRVIGTSARVLSAKNNNWLLGYWGGSQDRAFFEGWISQGSAATVLNQYNSYAATGTGSIATVYKNGVQIASNSNGLQGPNGIQLNGAGYSGSLTETSNCEFSDVIIYGSALPAATVGQLSENTAENQTLCINTPLINITQTTVSASGIGAVTNLPAGVSASWANNKITISGTPTVAGIFNYSIPLTGGCGSVYATGTITVNGVNAASSTPTPCINTPLTNITHTTTGVTGIGTATNLPAGVTASWANNTITISGTPTASGIFNYSIPLIIGCGNVNATGTINVGNIIAGAASSTPTLCVNTALTNITHTTTAATGIITYPAPSYALPPAIYSPTGEEDLGNITITSNGATILNNSTPVNSLSGTIGTAIGTAGSYANFTAFGPYAMYPGATYSFSLSSITASLYGSNSMAIYIDYNRNGVFTDAGEKVYAAAATTIGPHTETGTFTIPLSVSVGLTRMRVISRDNIITYPDHNNYSGFPDYSTSGEYEHYSINLGRSGGLPAGVTASWANNTVTISGTPTESGTFNYSIGLLGNCSTAAATGTINVNPADLQPSAGSNGNLTICSTTNLTEALLFAALRGTPAAGGVWSPTPNVANGSMTYTYTQPEIAPCGITSATVAVIVTTPTVTGNDMNTSVVTGQNITITPNMAPASATALMGYTNTNFKGLIAVDSTTGVINITNAHPAGTYSVIVKASDQGCAFATIALTVSKPPCSQKQFTNMSTISVDSWPNFVAVGDFNGDRKQDIATAHGSGTYNSIGSVSIRLGDGQGGFSGSTNVAVGSYPKSIAIGDFNRDGKQDIATANYNSATVSILLGDGLGGLSAATNVAVGVRPSSVAVGDFNGDGKQDIATANNTSNTVSIRLGDGLGGFSGTTNVVVGSEPTSVAVGDFNSDGKQDIAIATYYAISIRLGDGLGGFSGTNDFLVNLGSYHTSIALVDFNGDGKQDISTTTNSGSRVSISLGDGLGGFSNTIYATAYAKSQAIGDFNGDGKQDIIGVNGANMFIISDDGLGGCSVSREFLSTVTGVYYDAPVVGDFNEDGIQDIAMVRSSSLGQVLLRLGKPNAAEINLKGNGVTIASGNTNIVTSNNTDFGTASTRTFTIKNTGTGPLSISSIGISGADAASFTTNWITYPVIIAAGIESSFNLTCYSAILGTKTATVTINNDDCDEGAYSFKVQATNLPLTLGNYAAATILTAGGNATITPSAAPTGNGLGLTATTSADFKGKLTADPTTGVIRITNAQPAGVYQITVNTGLGLSRIFTLTVGNTICSQGQFLSPTSLNVGANPSCTEVADFNNDGYQDFAVILLNTSLYALNPICVSIQLGNGSGGFTTASTLPFIEKVFNLSINDFNGDGNADIVARGNSSLYILLGDGLGGFTSGATITLTSIGTLTSILSDDLDQDSKIDFVVSGTAGFTVLKGNGQGGFSVLNTYNNGIYLNFIEKGDFNGDGFTDLSLGIQTGGSNYIYFGNGNGGFGNATIYNLGATIRLSTIGDFDGDGKSDILSALANTPGTVAFQKNNGDGTFATPTYITVGDNAVQAVSGDFNGDGKLDFATGNSALSSVSVRYGNGDGTFYGTTELLTNAPASSTLRMIVGDFNNDGVQDIGTANNSATTDDFSIFLGVSKEINVQGNAVDIVSGDSSPDVADDSDFGTTTPNTPITKTYTIQNGGTSDLVVSTITLTGTAAASFTVGGIALPATIAAGTSTTFTVTFNTSTLGVQSATVSINNNDCDEGVYTFKVQGRANNYTVTFNANGGTGTMSDQTIAYLASANLTVNTLTRTGYSFVGWATTSGGAVAYTNGASYTMSAAANVTLYAKWCIHSASTTNVAVFSTSPTYLWNGIVRNAPGTYTYNTTNAIGCDSVATLNLTVVDPILPVTGIDLSGTASDKQVKLSYKALNEREMSNYAIERSAEGTSFTQIGMQQPINGNQASTSYGFIDNQPIVGMNYYRIQGNSLNGQIQYSNVIAVKAGNMMPTVTVAPNPILHQVLNLKLNQLVKGNYKMIITDVIGRTVYGKQLLYDGVGTFIKTNLPVSIKPGMYYVRLSGEGNDFMDKFIIQ